MKKRFVKLALLSAVLFAAAPAFAQSVDDKIKTLEQELSQLKEQQVELKKEAQDEQIDRGTTHRSRPAGWSGDTGPARDRGAAPICIRRRSSRVCHFAR